jgi:hypothetical protein
MAPEVYSRSLNVSLREFVLIKAHMSILVVVKRLPSLRIMTASNIPFPRSYELYQKLVLSPDGSKLVRHGESQKSTLPGFPRVTLSDPSMPHFLREELTTPQLNLFTPHLWKVATQSPTHITSLASQIVRGRRLILTQNPELHLVWIHDRIHIKPLPRFLLSYAFWEFIFEGGYSPLSQDQKREIGNAARGFLRSWSYLIRHKSDFTLAQEKGFVPRTIRYSEFVRFISTFEDVADDDVSARYSYGELRLKRLNLWAWLVLGRLEFHKVVWSYGDRFAQYYGPLLFVFGVCALVLSAMQVIWAVLPVIQANEWTGFAEWCLAFSIFTIATVGIAVLFLVASFVVRGVPEVLFALKDLWRQGRLLRRVRNGT